MRTPANRIALHPLLIAALVGCSGSERASGYNSTPQGDGGAAASSTADAGFGIDLGDGGGEASARVCPYQDNTDHDGDGFSFEDGDCNDCDPNSNPGAFDVAADGVDEDCDGVIDDEPTGCDAELTLDASDPFSAALAMDICRRTTATASGHERMWGVIDAQFVAPDNSDQCVSADGSGAASCASNANFALGHGNLTHLGGNLPEQGARMLAISSGTARDPSDPGYLPVGGFDKGYTVNAASGFPAPSPACPGVVTGQPHDGGGLRLMIRVPTNAKSLSFNENFFSYEFPSFICSPYNDAFVVGMTPTPVGLPTPNIAFDQAGNPLCVNNSLLQVCDPQVTGGKDFACPLGASSLTGTGFEGHAATGWLQTTVNIDASLRGQTITLVFSVWDSGDGYLDSTALIDNVVWSTQAGDAVPVTLPVAQ